MRDWTPPESLPVKNSLMVVSWHITTEYIIKSVP